jgi:hypothetical protein
VTFDGGSDEGSIETIDYGGNGSADMTDIDGSEIEVEIESSHRELDHDRWVSVRSIKRHSLDSAIEELTNDYLEETGVDWSTDDGGYGELSIDVTQGSVRLQVNTRYYETSIGHFSTRDILTGREIL